jgi:predicted flap endonuclease-1-like 5' DNA nuclease
MTKRRPFGITILAVLVGIDALFAAYHTLQFLHILPFSLGPIHFFAFDLLGALLWGISAVALIWIFYSLWNLHLEGWLFVIIVAILNLILAFLSVIGQSSFSAMFPAILINALVLIYCLTPGVQEAFKQGGMPAKAAAVTGGTRAVAAAAPAPVVPEIPVETRTAPIVELGLTAAPADVEDYAPPAEEALLVPEEAAIPMPSLGEKVAETPAAHARSHPKVPVETIEGIGPVFAAKLKAIGILFVSELLETGASRKGREELVEKSGISAAQILKWVNMADLMRISGVGEEYSELLEAAGVDTVKELRNRNPENLQKAMQQANEQRKMVRRTPNLSEVQSWVEQAKELEAILTY